MACFVRLLAGMGVLVSNVSSLSIAVAVALLFSLCNPAQAQRYLWAHASGSSIGSASSSAVAVDGRGDTVIGGSFSGSVDFGQGAVQSSGGPDGFVAKYSGVDGRPQWSLHIGGAGAFTNVNSVAADGTGGVYVTGSFTGSVSFPGGTLTSAGQSDAFLMKFDGTSGTLLWSLQLGGTGADAANGVDADTSGNLVVTGYFSGTANFGGTRLVSSSTSGFVAKYSAVNGLLLWAKALGGSGWAGGSSVAAGANGTVAVTGNFCGSVDFGGGSLVSAGGTDIFLAMYGASGTHLWSRAVGAAGNDGANGVAMDGSGNPVITGYFYNSVDFGGGSLPGAANQGSIFLAKYAGGNGSYLWAKAFVADSFGAVANGVAVDGVDNIALTGTLSGNVDFGGGLLVGTSNDIFMAEFSASGAYRWAQRFVALYPDAGTGIACDSSASVLIAGNFGNAVNFGGGTLSPGFGNAFVAKYASTTTLNTPTASPTQTPTPPLPSPTSAFTATRTATASYSPTVASSTPTRTRTSTATPPSNTSTPAWTATRTSTPAATATIPACLPASGNALDVDRNGTVDTATDIVYIARYLLNLPPVPQSYRTPGGPQIPSNDTVAARVAALGNWMDVDGNGAVDVATDLMYITRRLMCLLPVPLSIRNAYPDIPSDDSITAQIDALKARNL